VGITVSGARHLGRPPTRFLHNGQPSFSLWLNTRRRTTDDAGRLGCFVAVDIRDGCAARDIADPATLRRHLTGWHDFARESPLVRAIGPAYAEYLVAADLERAVGGAE